MSTGSAEARLRRVVAVMTGRQARPEYLEPDWTAKVDAELARLMALPDDELLPYLDRVVPGWRAW